jgi:3-hydroxyisobutyrate dehydrogenase-like beta-hydroxyacid dehydrogenase
MTANTNDRPAPRVGFIGFGEVAASFSAAVHQVAGGEVVAHDKLAEQPEGLKLLQARDRTGTLRLLPLAEVLNCSEIVLSLVTTSAAVPAARGAAGLLRPGQTYVDFNATAPAVKQEVARIIGPTGAHFVEGAILGAVGVTGARTRILIGDEAGAASAEQLARLGLNTVFYSEKIGAASAFKLLRSVFSKGIEALLIEFLVAGRRAGLQEDLWREVVDLFAQNSFEKVADNWIRTHGTAHERRYHEVVQVAAELRTLGLDPVMTAATEAVFRRSGELGLKERLAGRTATLDDVIAALESAPDRGPPGGAPAAR